MASLATYPELVAEPLSAAEPLGPSAFRPRSERCAERLEQGGLGERAATVGNDDKALRLLVQLKQEADRVKVFVNGDAWMHYN